MNLVHGPNNPRKEGYNDRDTKQLPGAHIQSCPVTDPTWASTYRDQNNVLHLMARTSKVETLA